MIDCSLPPIKQKMRRVPHSKREDGKTHTNADALSRWPLNDTEQDKESGEEVEKVINFISNVKEEPEVHSCPIAVTSEEQEKDTCIKWLKELVMENGDVKPILPNDELDTNLKRILYTHYHQLKVIDGRLYWFKEDDKGDTTPLLILPVQMVGHIIKFIHSSILNGHLGVRKTLDKIKN
ncbi:hypothetical protein BpHYR1_048110, partial [Brachionus plicatilis]